MLYVYAVVRSGYRALFLTRLEETTSSSLLLYTCIYIFVCTNICIYIHEKIIEHRETLKFVEHFFQHLFYLYCL